MDLADEKYLSLTTFTADGRPKPTPVWIAAVGGGQFGFTTSLTSWKVRRIRKSPKVLLQPCDMRGRPKAGSEVVEGSAEILEGAAYDRVRAAVAGKYGWQYSMVGLRNRAKKLFGKSVPADCGVVITPDG